MTKLTKLGPIERLHISERMTRAGYWSDYTCKEACDVIDASLALALKDTGVGHKMPFTQEEVDAAHARMLLYPEAARAASILRFKNGWAGVGGEGGFPVNLQILAGW